MRNLAAGFFGVALGALLMAPSRDDPVTPSTPSYDLRALDDALARLSAVSAVRDPVRADNDGAGESAVREEDAGMQPVTARSRHLRRLAISPTNRRALGNQVLDGAYLSRTHAFRSYEDVLSEFGRPDSYGVRDGLGAFHYSLDDGSSSQRSISFLFHDGRVVQVEAR